MMETFFDESGYENGALWAPLAARYGADGA
jgi:hypothetical protein